MTVRYRRTRGGPPITVKRPDVDPFLEASPRWTRLDDTPTPDTPADDKET